MAIILKPVAVHSMVANAPYIISAAATASPASARTFNGVGPPTSSTLAAGNGMYNAATSGYLINASLNSPGGGYAVGDVLTVSGGTGTSMQISVDMVNATGAILDFHLSRVGNYSVYPTADASVSGGTGSGATFYLNVPAPDYYLDLTAPAAPVLYLCTTSGGNTASAWSKLGGGSSAATMQQFQIQSDAGDYWVCYTWDGATLGTLNVNVIKPFKLRAGPNAIASETIRGVTYTYTYAYDSTNGYYTRAVSGSDGSSETDYLTPDAIAAADYLYAMPCATNIVTGIPQTIATAVMTAAGSGYTASQVLTLQGGTGAKATVKVLTVASSGGAILTYQLLTGGNYTALPGSLSNVTVNTGAATFNLTVAPQLLDLNVDGRAWAK